MGLLNKVGPSEMLSNEAKPSKLLHLTDSFIPLLPAHSFEFLYLILWSLSIHIWNTWQDKQDN